VEGGTLSLSEMHEVPRNSLILLAGPPGAGKSTFCHQTVLNRLTLDRPVIFVTTESDPVGVERLLREKGLGEMPLGTLHFVDAFSRTVGLATPKRADTVHASCEDLNSLSMAIAKLQRSTPRKDVLLVFDSLTSPYLFNKDEVFRFVRLCLQRFAADGNAVLALVDEGCGKEEDLVAMMTAADGILRMEVGEHSRVMKVVKHPKLAPAKVETPIAWSPAIDHRTMDPRVVTGVMRDAFLRSGRPLRSTIQDDLVNVLWKNLASWSGMLWDPKRFPTMAYELDKQAHASARELYPAMPWRTRLLLKLVVPKSFSEVNVMRRFVTRMSKARARQGYGLMEYVEDESRKDDHCLRMYENSSCWGFEGVGARLGFHPCGEMAGGYMGMEKVERDWNVVETKCIGLGDSYCEFRVVAGRIPELKDALESIDSSVVARVHDRLMDQLIGFLVHGRPLPERPTVGGSVFFEEMHHVTGVPAMLSDRYRMALRMGGAKVGKEVGEHLADASVVGDEAIGRVIDLMETCQVGEIALGDTIQIRDNCESFGLATGQPSCNFTTGFLNGVYSAVKGQHVREVKCIAAGDPYCEWEIV
jgi:predicted hydrocarbon binding protein/KaiC/GvpD/RAD55 family RecA-like ATPase